MPLRGHRPHFDKPPVIEVVCGVQFEALELWKTTHYGQFWSKIKTDYSETQDVAPLVTVNLEPNVQPEPLWSQLPPLRRVFYIHPPGNFLIQLQANRFLHNWRTVKDTDEYPRFEAAYERFTKYWREFRHFLAEVSLPEPKSQIWELTYINHIIGEGGRAFRGMYGTSYRFMKRVLKPRLRWKRLRWQFSSFGLCRIRLALLLLM